MRISPNRKPFNSDWLSLGPLTGAFTGFGVAV